MYKERASETMGCACLCKSNGCEGLQVSDKVSHNISHFFRMLSSSVPSLSLILRGFATSARCDINCHRASIARIGRLTYSRTYPVLLVQSDGSTINIRYHEPRKIVKVMMQLSQVLFGKLCLCIAISLMSHSGLLSVLQLVELNFMLSLPFFPLFIYH